MSIKMTSKSNKQNTTINEALNKKLKEPETITSTSTTMTSKSNKQNSTTIDIDKMEATFCKVGNASIQRRCCCGGGGGRRQCSKEL